MCAPDSRSCLCCGINGPGHSFLWNEARAYHLGSAVRASLNRREKAFLLAAITLGWLGRCVVGGRLSVWFRLVSVAEPYLPPLPSFVFSWRVSAHCAGSQNHQAFDSPQYNIHCSIPTRHQSPTQQNIFLEGTGARSQSDNGKSISCRAAEHRAFNDMPKCLSLKYELFRSATGVQQRPCCGDPNVSQWP